MGGLRGLRAGGCHQDQVLDLAWVGVCLVGPQPLEDPGEGWIVLAQLQADRELSDCGWGLGGDVVKPLGNVARFHELGHEEAQGVGSSGLCLEAAKSGENVIKSEFMSAESELCFHGDWGGWVKTRRWFRKNWLLNVGLHESPCVLANPMEFPRLCGFHLRCSSKQSSSRKKWLSFRKSIQPFVEKSNLRSFSRKHGKF